MERIKEDRPITIKDDKGNLNRCIADVVSVRSGREGVGQSLPTAQVKGEKGQRVGLALSGPSLGLRDLSFLSLPALHHGDGQAAPGDPSHGRGMASGWVRGTGTGTGDKAMGPATVAFADSA